MTVVDYLLYLLWRSVALPMPVFSNAARYHGRRGAVRYWRERIAWPNSMYYLRRAETRRR
ncbi:hypothetical protein ACN27J_03235 [Solwaraspora sp. WMMB762]|uniref:hypothetical protein n=1 Tax=Solwaraspora sp. WMMB762 TaxID=3404120 RepID=UPI003B96529F